MRVWLRARWSPKVLLLPLLLWAACGEDEGATDPRIDVSVADVGMGGSDATPDAVDPGEDDGTSDVPVEPDVPIEPDPRASQVPAGDPGVLGPWAVGITTFELPGEDGGKPIPVEVWYPAAGSGDALTEYDALGVKLPAGGYRDVPPDPAAPAFVVAFSHGLGGVRIQNMSMAERLASYGFIVVAPDHPGTTTLEFLRRVGDLSGPLLSRPGTLQSAVDALFAGAVPTLTPRTDRYAVVGHSLGAVTSLILSGAMFDPDLYAEACKATPKPFECGLIGKVEISDEDLAKVVSGDPRIVTAVLQNPAGAFALLPETVARLPVSLVIGGELDKPNETVVPIHGMMVDGSVLAVYDAAGHNAATDICKIQAAKPFSPDCDGPSAGFAEPEVVRELIVGHTVAWLGATIGGQPAFGAYLVDGEGYSWVVGGP